MTFEAAEQSLTNALDGFYENREAATIAGMVMEFITGKSKMDRWLQKNELLSIEDLKQQEQYTKELLTGKPVQYVLGQAWFAGLCLQVNEHTLIPRPETEELVNLCASWATTNKMQHAPLKILEVGTGSGCIAIALQKKQPSAQITAVDISTEAIKVASANAIANNTAITFITLDFLTSNKASLQFNIESREVIRYCSLNTKDAIIIETILRNYTGVFEQITQINTALIAKKSGKPEEKVVAVLKKLEALEMISLQLQSSDISILYNEPREDNYTINRVIKVLENQNQIKTTQYEQMLLFVNNTSQCKSVLLANYFGEENPKNCGICSYCVSKNKSETKSVSKSILNLLEKTPLSSNEMENAIPFSTEEIIFALQNLLENDVIYLNSDNQYQIK